MGVAIGFQRSVKDDTHDDHSPPKKPFARGGSCPVSAAQSSRSWVGTRTETDRYGSARAINFQLASDGPSGQNGGTGQWIDRSTGYLSIRFQRGGLATIDLGRFGNSGGVATSDKSRRFAKLDGTNRVEVDFGGHVTRHRFGDLDYPKTDAW